MVKAEKTAKLENVKHEPVYSGIVTCPHCNKKHGVWLELSNSCNKTEKEKEQ